MTSSLFKNFKTTSPTKLKFGYVPLSCILRTSFNGMIRRLNIAAKLRDGWRLEGPTFVCSPGLRVRPRGGQRPRHEQLDVRVVLAVRDHRGDLFRAAVLQGHPVPLQHVVACNTRACHSAAVVGSCRGRLVVRRCVHT